MNNVTPISKLIGANEIEYISRIKFSGLPESTELARKRLADGQVQILSAYPNSLVTWPLDEKTFVAELRDTGNRADAIALAEAHRLSTAAMLQVLTENNGFAEIVSPADFASTGPRSTDA